MEEEARHVRLSPTWLIKRWLLVLPILNGAVVIILLATADSPESYILVATALMGGVVVGLYALPTGEGQPLPPWLLLLLLFLWLLGVGPLSLAVGCSPLFTLCSLAVGLMTYAIVAAIRVMRLRSISWDSIVTAPWRPPRG